MIFTVDSVLVKVAESSAVEKAGIMEGLMEFCEFPFDRPESVFCVVGRSGVKVVSVFVCWFEMSEKEEVAA